MRISPQYFLLVIVFLLAAYCRAQQANRFDQLNAEQGFNQSIVYQLAQDDYGNLWATTEEGVVRFNSRESFEYNAAAGLPDGFGENVRAVHIDAAGRTWIGGDLGVAIYRPEMDRFEMVVATGFTPSLVKDLLVTETGNLWVAGYNGLWRYRTSAGTGEKVANIRGVEAMHLQGGKLYFGALEGLYQLALENEEWTPTELKATVTTMLATADGYLAGTKDGRLFAFSEGTQTPALVYEVSGFPIRDIEPGSNGGWLVATDGVGVHLLDNNYQRLGSYRNDVDNPRSISSNGVYDLLTDREGILWIATYGGGVNKLDPHGNTFGHLTHVINTQESLGHPFTRAILEDEEGRIWFGTKRGVSIWLRASGKWQHLLQENNGEGSQIITSLVEQGPYVWATSFQGQLIKIDKKNYEYEVLPFTNQVNTESGRIFSTAFDKEENLWIGGVNMNLYRIDPEGNTTNYPLQQVKAMAVAADGKVFVGSSDGLKVIKGADAGATIGTIKAVEKHRSETGYTALNAISLGLDDVLYLGTNGAGLVRYNPTTEALSTITMKDGLPSNNVRTIQIDGTGNVWAGTARGLVRISQDTTATSIRVYNKGDGLLSNEFNAGSAARLRDGTMLFGGIEGVTLFQPAEVISPVKPPKVVFEDLYLLNERQRPGGEVLPAHINALQELSLDYDENALTFHFTGVSQAAAEKVRYRWRLKGLNDQWSPPTSLNQLNFTNLEPGSYTFKIQASISPGNWGPIRDLSLVISPPWWKTWWASLIYLALVAATFYVLFRISRGLIRRRNAERQIDFFNNITHELKTPLAILLASLEDATETGDESDRTINHKIKATVKRLNALFEQLLNFHKASSTGKSRHVTAFTPGERALELTEHFRPLLQERRLQLFVQANGAPPQFHYDKEIFDKIIFNLVSNAVKYSREGGIITVALASSSADRLELKVIDNGIGIPEDQQKYILREYYRARNVINSQLPGTGLGLMMVKSMVEKEGGTIHFTSKENEGTTFTVVMNDRRDDLPATGPAPAPSLAPASAPENLLDEGTDGLESTQILLVEDNDELRADLATKLSKHFRVITASDGREGLEKAAEVFPDLIITDLIMPEMDGMELSRAVQADIQLNHIPIYMLTVLHNSAQKVESIEAGVTEYLEKPVNFALLLAKITNTLRWRRRMRERYAAQDEADRADQYRSERESEFIGNLEAFMHQNIGSGTLSVQDLCRHVGMSRTALYMKMKNLIDLSPQDFIIHTRLREARRLLMETDETVKGIAYDCGFSNPKYFSTSFKKKYGVSPGAFRKGLL